MTELDEWFVHTVDLQTFQGTGAKGAVFASAVPTPCLVEDAVQLVRTADGREVTSSTRVFAAAGYESAFKPESKVTLPSGRTATVIRTGTFDTGTINPDLDHIEVALT